MLPRHLATDTTQGGVCCPVPGCCDCSPAPAASPCPRTRWGPGNSGHRAGRLASWYETGAWAPLVDSITYKQPNHTLIMVFSPPFLPLPARKPGTARGGSSNSGPCAGRQAPCYETGAWAPLVCSITISYLNLTLLVVSSHMCPPSSIRGPGTSRDKSCNTDTPLWQTGVMVRNGGGWPGCS